jgi:ADP-ribosyl-[dinitrogen reductase] hydrolase
VPTIHPDLPTPIVLLRHEAFEGAIGLAPAPSHWRGGADLRGRLLRLRRAGGSVLASLVPAGELGDLGLSRLGEEAGAAGIDWHHLPIVDMEPPADAFEAGWPPAEAAIRGALEGGGIAVLHCWAGLGRTGTIAARLLVGYGEPPDRAIELVRAIRPGAVQTRAQEAYVHAIAAARRG